MLKQNLATQFHSLVPLSIGGAIALAIGCSQDSAVSYEEGLPEASLEAGMEDHAFGADDAGDADACKLHCSSDLHRILDCEGRVVQECREDQGCGPSGCATACEAANETRTAFGCEYYVRQLERLTTCNALLVMNTWGTPVYLSADVKGTPVDVASHTYVLGNTGSIVSYEPATEGIPAGAVGVMFLRGDSCPKPPAQDTAPAAWTDPMMSTTSIHGVALHLTTSAPVTIIGAFPDMSGAGFAVSSESLLLPVPVWDTNYVAVTPYPDGLNAEPPGIAITASADGTEVTILPTVDIAPNDAGVEATLANVPHTYHLDQGEVLAIAQHADLVGSVISATKPVGLTSEQTAFNIDKCCADESYQMIPPVRALGSEYVGVRYENRVPGKEETPPWRIVGLVDGTKLAWDPARPEGAPEELRQGDAVFFRASGPFVVKSQDDAHPFFLASYMTGGGADNPKDPQDFNGIGDPEVVGVLPVKQYLSRYLLWVDPRGARANAVFVRAKAGDGTFKSVTLDCVGEVTDWAPAGSTGDYEYTRVSFATGLPCELGRHEATSDGPFVVTVWGTVQHGSYAFLAGMGVGQVNAVVVPAIPH